MWHSNIVHSLDLSICKGRTIASIIIKSMYASYLACAHLANNVGQWHADRANGEHIDMECVYHTSYVSHWHVTSAKACVYEGEMCACSK